MRVRLGIALVILAAPLLAQEGEDPKPHPLTAYNGTPESEEYPAGTNVSITATPPSGGQRTGSTDKWHFIMWLPIEGGGEIKDVYSSRTSFVMPGHAVKIAAVYATYNIWFPPGSEDIKVGLLMPKPSRVAQRQRMEMHFRVKLDAGGAEDAPLDVVWSALKVNLSWFPEQEGVWHSNNVAFYNQQKGGSQVVNDKYVPTPFAIQSKDTQQEGSVWYEGQWDYKEIEEKGVAPKILLRSTLVLRKIPEFWAHLHQETGTLLPIEIIGFFSANLGAGVQTSGLSAGNVVVWGRSLVSATIKVPPPIDPTLVEPRFVQDVIPQRTRYFATATSQGHTRERIQYQNQKVLDNILDSTSSLVVIQREGQNIVIESRDEPAQRGEITHQRIVVGDSFETYLQCAGVEQGWHNFGKALWWFNAEAVRSTKSWNGTARITGSQGQFTSEEPVFQPHIYPITWVAE